MALLVVVSLAVNIVVLVPITFGLLADAEWARHVYGPRQPGRQILLAVYSAILIVSAGLLVRGDTHGALALFAVQVVYKVLSLLTVGNARNPVVVSNLAIAALHTVTIASQLR